MDLITSIESSITLGIEGRVPPRVGVLYYFKKAVVLGLALAQFSILPLLPLLLYDIRILI